MAVIPGVLLILVFLQIRWVQVASNFGERRSQIHMLRPLVERARREPVTYEQALAAPTAFAGRPVVWCVDHPSTGASFLDGRPLSWVNDGDAEKNLPTNGPTTGGRCTTVVAVIEGAKTGKLALRYVGLL